MNEFRDRPATYGQVAALCREVATLREDIRIMSTTLSTDVAALTAAVSAMTTAVDTEVAAIQQLVAGGSPSQADLDAITAATTNIQAATAALVASLPQPASTTGGGA